MSPMNPLSTRAAKSQRSRVRVAKGRFGSGRRNSRPGLEFLEERTLLSTDMVMNSNDSGAGSLRNAIANASAGDTIEFNMSSGHVTSPITLTTGELDITQNLKIVGPGPSSLTISGNSASTIFSVATGVNVTISGLTLANGESASGAGGIYNLGHLTLTDDVLSNNTGALAGGIFSESGSLSMSDCTSTLNSASSASGGGIYVLSGAVTIKNSTFDSNSATFFGGAIFDNAGTVLLIDSTFTANNAQEGGGIDNYGGLSLINCTVADNSAQDDGGGINNDVSGTMTLANTIIADNSAVVVGPDYHGTVTSDSGNNLIGDDAGSSGFTQPSDLLNVNPLLAALKDNGGPTQTMGLMPGSPAIDAGNTSLLPPGDVADQRGFSRTANGSVDIGAFEVQTFLVLNSADSGADSLRTALTNADLAGGSDIFFATSGVIELASALPAITSDVYITGPGANNLSISGSGLYQVFDIQEGVTATISGLTITDGLSVGSGGAIENDGTLTLTNCTVSNSTSSGDGGGIDNEGTLTVNASTVSGNSTENDAGGIENDGTLTLVNSTVADNSASSGVGGGINNAGTLTAINSTFADNSAFDGGGIEAGGVVTLVNTIVGDDSLTGGSGVDFNGNVANDEGNNLIGDSSGSTGFIQSTDILDVDPLLSPLGNYGGPTQTISLLPGSPAIDAGSNASAAFGGSALTTDQRGFTRINDGIVDIGAVEIHLFTITILFGNNQSTNVKTDFNTLLTVVLTSAWGEPVFGGIVTFSGPGSGASATFPGGNWVITSPAGTASILAEANSIAGSYSVAATSAGAGAKHFSLTNNVGAATQLVIQTQPSAMAAAGLPFGTQPVVYVEDQYGNLETGDNSTQVTVASLPMGSGPLQGTTIVTASGGIATFTNLSDPLPETITLHFTSSPALTAATSNSIVVVAAATQLVINTQPSSTATAGVAFATQPVVYVEDQYGNLETTDNTTQVTASLFSGSGPLDGTTTVTVSGGIATFTNLADNTAETISLHFTSVPALTDATSDSIVVSPAAASMLVVGTQPSLLATAGVPFSTQPVVYIEDQYGNLETGDNSTQVSVASLPMGSGPLHGTTMATASGGIATFTNLADNKAETISLEFTSVPALTSTTSNSIVVSPAAATQLMIATQPSPTATAGVAFSTQPVVYIEDQYGNLENLDDSTVVTAVSLPVGSGPLRGTTMMTASGGVVTFTDLADKTAETIALGFTSVPVLAAATSNNIVVSPAAATQMVIVTQPSPTATAGVAFHTQPVISIEDQYGNVETGDNSTDVTAALNSGTGPLLGTTTVTVTDGIGAFTNLADNTAETISLEFTSVPALTAATSNNIVVSPASATQLVIATQPSPTATAGVAFATQPVVYIEDQYGNVETGDNSTEVSVVSLPIGSGPLQGTTMVTASGGIAAFTNLADNTAETISLEFTSVPALSAATSNNIVVSPAAATQLVIAAQPSPTAIAGVQFSTQPVVYIEDQFGNLETGDNSTQVSVALHSGTGPLFGTTTETASGGIAAFTDLSDRNAETASLEFTSIPALTAATSNDIVVSPGAATQLVLETEPSPTATAGVAFSTQPVIFVEDQYGNLETGDNSTQVTVSSLPVGSGPLQGTTTLTVSGGSVYFTGLADDKAETISLQFTSVPALTSATSNNIMVSPAAASQLVIATQPSPTATAGVAFATQPVVDIEDQYGNLETGDNSTEVSAAALPLGSGPLQGTTMVTASGGVATFTDLSENKAGTITLQFTSSPVLAAASSSSIVVSSTGVATQLGINTQPSPTATAGVVFSTQPVIYVEDQYGNLITGDNSTEVTASLASGTGPLLGTTTVTVSGGIATFTDLSDDTAETISLQFVSVPALTTAVSNNIVVSPAAATQLVLSTQPSSTATAGVAFSTQPVIYVEDQYGNVETGDDSTQVTAASLPIGSGPLRGTTTVTVSGGIATFASLADNTAETITIDFTSVPALSAATSSNVVVSPAAASKLVLSTQPSATATAGAAFGTQPVVDIEDQYGNLETGDNTTQVTAGSFPLGSGPLRGTTTVTASGGIATFTNLADNVAETITINFTSSPILTSATSSNVVVSPAAATQLVLNTEPSATATAGVPFLTQPVVYVEDQYGNVETGDNTTQVTAALNVGTGPLQGTTTLTVSGGIATFTNLSDNTAETIALLFTSVPVLTTQLSGAIVVSPAAASQLVIATQPSSTAAAGVAFSTQPVVYIEDQYGNIETGNNTTQVTAASLPLGSGPLQGTTTVTASGGIATFTNLADNKAETITIHFTSSPVLTAATSSNIVISPAASSQLVLSTQPSPTATAGVAFATQPVVDVEDQYGNIETGDNTTQVSVALNFGTGPLLGTTTVTVSGGIATFTNLSDNKAETISLEFTSAPVLTSAISNNIVISPAAATQLILSTQPSPTARAGVAFSTQPVVYVEDQYGNVETGDNSTQVTATSLPLGSGPLHGTTTVTAAAGIATFTNLADDKAETITIHFTSSPVLTAAMSNSIVICPAAASQLVLSTQPSPTATAGVAFLTQPVVEVEDQYGNLETGDDSTQVTAGSLPPGSGPLQGTTTVTVSGGIATFANLSDSKAGTIELQFTSVPVLSSATSNNIVISPAAATQLAIHIEPSASAAQFVPFNPQPVVYVEDQYGNRETGDNTTRVTASLSTGSGPLLGTTTVTVSGGIATFTNLADATAETITLRFTSTPALDPAVSNPIVVAQQVPYQLVLETQPSASATAGQASPTQPVIYVEDAAGNLVVGDNTTQVTVSLRVGSGPLLGTTTITASAGIAAFTNLTDDKAEAIILSFTASGLVKAQTNSITVSPAAASKLSITAPATVTAGRSFTITVTAFDPYNNVATGYRGTVRFASSDRAATLPANYTFTTSDAGVHTFGNGVTLKTKGSQTIAVFDLSNQSITGSTSVNVGAAPLVAALSIGAQGGSSGGQVHTEVAIQAQPSKANPAVAVLAHRQNAKMERRRRIAHADRVRDRLLAEMTGSLRAYVISERLTDI
jgi:hypothetical protein